MRQGGAGGVAKIFEVYNPKRCIFKAFFPFFYVIFLPFSIPFFIFSLTLNFSFFSPSDQVFCIIGIYPFIPAMELRREVRSCRSVSCSNVTSPVYSSLTSNNLGVRIQIGGQAISQYAKYQVMDTIKFIQYTVSVKSSFQSSAYIIVSDSEFNSR